MYEKLSQEKNLPLFKLQYQYSIEVLNLAIARVVTCNHRIIYIPNSATYNEHSNSSFSMFELRL